MRITLIRHGKVDMDWKKKYTSAEYDAAWAQYDECDILPVTKRLSLPEDVKVYVTPMKRTHQTAEQFLGIKEYTVIDDLANEVPLRAYKDSHRRRRLWYMNFRGRAQWWLPNHRQEERRHQTYARAQQLLNRLEQEDRDVVLVSHGFFIRAMAIVLKKNGYKLDDMHRFKVPNLCTIDAVKESE